MNYVPNLNDQQQLLLEHHSLTKTINIYFQKNQYFSSAHTPPLQEDDDLFFVRLRPLNFHAQVRRTAQPKLSNK